MATYTLNSNANTIAGSASADTFNGTYDEDSLDTFNDNDVLNGLGGIDTLRIDHFENVAITPPDALWTGIRNIEKIVMRTTGDGAQTITTGSAFESAFAPAGVSLKTTTTGGGAIDITMSSFSGTAKLATTSTDGAQTIVTGLGDATVAALSGAGALTIKGIGLESVTAETTGAGAQTIGDSSGNGRNLVEVMAVSAGGEQTIVSTSTSAVTVNATSLAGEQNITTGTGADVIAAATSAGNNIISTKAGDDKIVVLATSVGSYTLNGGSGNDSISGGAGADTLVGGEGNDVMDGRSGADSMSGGNGNDRFSVRSANDVITETNASAATGGYDTVNSYLAAYTLGANVENGRIMLTESANLAGNGLNNVLYGGIGDNSLNGGSGNDTLSGGAGNDVLTGGTGKDSLTGGAGNDRFDFNALTEMGTTVSNRDVITGFIRGQDKIDLSSIDANTASTTINNSFTQFISSAAAFTAAGQLKFSGGVLYGNTDADSAAEFSIQLTGLTALSTADFVL